MNDFFSVASVFYPRELVSSIKKRFPRFSSLSDDVVLELFLMCFSYLDPVVLDSCLRILGGSSHEDK